MIDSSSNAIRGYDGAAVDLGLKRGTALPPTALAAATSGTLVLAPLAVDSPMGVRVYSARSSVSGAGDAGGSGHAASACRSSSPPTSNNMVREGSISNPPPSSASSSVRTAEYVVVAKHLPPLLVRPSSRNNNTTDTIITTAPTITTIITTPPAAANAAAPTATTTTMEPPSRGISGAAPPLPPLNGNATTAPTPHTNTDTTTTAIGSADCCAPHVPALRLEDGEPHSIIVAAARGGTTTVGIDTVPAPAPTPAAATIARYIVHTDPSDWSTGGFFHPGDHGGTRVGGVDPLQQQQEQQWHSVFGNSVPNPFAIDGSRPLSGELSSGLFGSGGGGFTFGGGGTKKKAGGGGLFGSAGNSNNGGLFSTTTAAASKAASAGLFGNAAAAAKPVASSRAATAAIFVASTAAPAQALQFNWSQQQQQPQVARDFQFSAPTAISNSLFATPSPAPAAFVFGNPSSSLF